VRARVCLSRGETARLWIDGQEQEAAVRGLLLAEGNLPVTGDWVEARFADAALFIIEEIEPRKTSISRRAAGREAKQQILAANIDVALIVCGLDGDFNQRRLERYLAIAHEGGVEPVVVLNKADLCADPPTEIRGARTLVVSAQTGTGFEELHSILQDGVTAVMLGSSGVGKSSILNRLLGEDRQRTGAVRESDSRGRHTTSHREMVRLPSGAVMIDTPGLREIQLLVHQPAIDAVFDEIAELADHCRFRDCSHHNEPGCAVRGSVDPQRLESFHKLGREASRLTGEWREKQQWRSIHKAQKQFYKDRGR
jgi:ribosome biogenesis GTPase